MILTNFAAFVIENGALLVYIANKKSFAFPVL